MKIALKPLVRLALTFAIVWFFHGLTAGLLSGGARLVAVIALSIATWLVVSRALFPADRESGPWFRNETE